MMGTAFLEAVRAGFWPVYTGAIILAFMATMKRRNLCLGRTALAMLANTYAQSVWEGSGYLLWWQALVIDVPFFVIVTIPPKSYWQSAFAGLLLTQIILHFVWGVSEGVAGAARLHWLWVTTLAYVQCIVLALWSGGRHVQAAFYHIRALAAHLVLAAFHKKSAG